MSNDTIFNIEDIGEKIIEKLMLDKQIDEVIATDLFFNSATFADPETEVTQLRKFSLPEIYEILKLELKKQ